MLRIKLGSSQKTQYVLNNSSKTVKFELDNSILDSLIFNVIYFKKKNMFLGKGNPSYRSLVLKAKKIVSNAEILRFISSYHVHRLE
jgi:hypothetical protein